MSASSAVPLGAHARYPAVAMPGPSDSRWLFVSRPVVGPVFEGGPSLLRELIPSLPDAPCDYFGDHRQPLRPLSYGDGILRVPRLPGHRGAALLERAAIGAALVRRDRRRQPVHLFFNPGPLTERVAAGLVAAPTPPSSTSLAVRARGTLRGALGIASGMLGGRKRTQRPAPVAQTLTCSTGLETWGHLLESLDAIVALSDHTRDRLLGCGLDRTRVHRIYPGVRGDGARAIDSPGALEKRRAILYAGELDLGATDRLIELARTLSEPTMRGWTLIIACRPDQVVEQRERDRLARELAGAIGAGRVELRGEVDDMRALLRRCAIQLFVADKIHRRPDIPLVLLEGLHQGLPLVTLDWAPIRELHVVADQRGRTIGARVDPTLGPTGIVRAVHDLIEHPETLVAMSHDALALAREAFSAARMGADYAALHRELAR